MSGPCELDSELIAVVEAIRSQDPTGARTAKVLRETIDQLYDGQRTGRYRWDQLFKTEKTHCGTLVEINLQREFKFQDGLKLDFSIAGIEVDCKYSQRLNGWMIPPEAIGHVCMLVTAEDTAEPTWNLGIVRVTQAKLNIGSNRDAKATLNAEGRQSIVWLWQNAPLPPNVLLQLDEQVVQRIMSLKSGVKRVNELFRCALGRIVSRNVVATVAQQDDYMKRVRTNGGARSVLKKEGIIILGQYKAHVAIASALNLPLPGPGDSIAIRVTKAEALGVGVVTIAGSLWKRASQDDPVIEAPSFLV